MKKIVSVLMLLVIMVSCNSAKNRGSQEFSVLVSSTIGGSDKFAYAILDNNTDFAEAISNLPIEENDYESLLNINFKQHNVLILHLGQKNTGGYSIEIKNIKNVNDKVTVNYKVNKPKPGEMVTMALTNPFTVVLIPKAKETEIEESK